MLEQTHRLIAVVRVCTLSVMVTVAVGVTVGVPVAVVTIGRLGAVQDYGHVVVLATVINNVQLLEKFLLEKTGTKHEDCPVCNRSDNLSVGNYVHRGTVQNQIIILLLQNLDGIREGL